MAEYFSFDFSPLAWCFLAGAAACVIVALLYGLKAYRKAASLSAPPVPEDLAGCPKASVIIYALGGSEDVIMKAMEGVMSQDYPDYEVVVVCDGSMAQANYLSEAIATVYPDVYVTFMQPGSHNLSRRKLATTIGVKAAKGDVVITTVANIEIPSRRWLSSLMAPFCGEGGEEIDVVLGVSRMDFNELSGIGKWYRQFDSVISDALWIGYAASGKPYRGDGYNLAFRRSVFFEHKGYARTINLHYGDDDLFISEISNGTNTRVVADDDCILTTKWDDAANRVWAMRKARYNFTSRWLVRAPFVRAMTAKLMQWLVPGLIAAAVVTGLPSLMPSAIALVLLLTFWGFEIAGYRRLAPRLKAIRLWWAVVPFWLWKTPADLYFRYRHYGSRKKNFTYQRHHGKK